MGVSLRYSFAVKTIFKNLLGELAEITHVYAGFSPVRSAGRNHFLLPLVVQRTLHNYILYFPSSIRPFPFRHILYLVRPPTAFTAPQNHENGPPDGVSLPNSSVIPLGGLSTKGALRVYLRLSPLPFPILYFFAVLPVPSTPKSHTK